MFALILTMSNIILFGRSESKIYIFVVVKMTMPNYRPNEYFNRVDSKFNDEFNLRDLFKRCSGCIEGLRNARDSNIKSF